MKKAMMQRRGREEGRRRRVGDVKDLSWAAELKAASVIGIMTATLVGPINRRQYDDRDVTVDRDYDPTLRFEGS